MQSRRFAGPYRRYQRRRASRRFLACLPGLALILFSLAAFIWWAWIELQREAAVIGSVPF